jgi:hypothetical protein
VKPNPWPVLPPCACWIPRCVPTLLFPGAMRSSHLSLATPPKMQWTAARDRCPECLRTDISSDPDGLVGKVYVMKLRIR